MDYILKYQIELAEELHRTFKIKAQNPDSNISLGEIQKWLSDSLKKVIGEPHKYNHISTPDSCPLRDCRGWLKVIEVTKWVPMSNYAHHTTDIESECSVCGSRFEKE